MKEVLYSRLLNQATDSAPTPQAANYVFPEVYRRHVLTLKFPFHARKQIVHFDELRVFFPVPGTHSKTLKSLVKVLLSLLIMRPARKEECQPNFQLVFRRAVFFSCKGFTFFRLIIIDLFLKYIRNFHRLFVYLWEKICV